MTMTNVLLIIIIIILVPGLIGILGMVGLMIAIPICVVGAWYSVYKVLKKNSNQEVPKANRASIANANLPFSVTLKSNHQLYYLHNYRSDGLEPLGTRLFDDETVEIIRIHWFQTNNGKESLCGKVKGLMVKSHRDEKHINEEEAWIDLDGLSNSEKMTLNKDIDIFE